MTKEEILQKQNITEEELFTLFEVKNLDSLIVHLDMKTLKPLTNQDYIYDSFSTILEKVKEVNFNPIQERYYLLAIAFKGFYGVDIAYLNAIGKAYGYFRATSILNDILKDNKDFKFYLEMYEHYIKNSSNLTLMLFDSVKNIATALIDKVGSFTPEDIQKYVDEIKNSMEKIAVDVK
jgi:hypothetical protein